MYSIIYIPGEDELFVDDEDEGINPKDIVITGSADHTAKIWSFDTGGCVKTLIVSSENRKMYYSDIIA